MAEEDKNKEFGSGHCHRSAARLMMLLCYTDFVLRAANKLRGMTSGSPGCSSCGISMNYYITSACLLACFAAVKNKYLFYPFCTR